MKTEDEVKALRACVDESIAYVQEDVARLKSSFSGYTYQERKEILSQYETVLTRLCAKREVLALVLDSYA